MDYWLAIVATLFTLTSALRAAWQLFRGHFERHYFNLVVLGGAFLSLFGALILRGEVQGACPLHGISDILMFLAWGILGFYLVAGPAMRLSLIGYFTAPLTFLMLIMAVIPGVWQQAEPLEKEIRPWIEAHASLSMLAYAGFSLAAVAGFMFLLLDKQLKAQDVAALGWSLPPLHHLEKATLRLCFWSWLLLSVGIFAGIVDGQLGWSVKNVVTSLLWAFIGLICLLHWRQKLQAVRFTTLVIAAFVAAMLSILLL